MSKPPSDDPRTFTLCVRLTEAERDEVERLRGGLIASEWIRSVLFKRKVK